MLYHIRASQNESFLQVNLFVKAIPLTATKFSLESYCVNILLRTCTFCCAILLFQPLSIISDITCSQCFDVPVFAKYGNQFWLKMLNGYTRKQKTSKTDHFDPLNVAYVWLLLSHMQRLLVAYMRLHICGSYFDFAVVTGQLKHGREYHLQLSPVA